METNNFGVTISEITSMAEGVKGFHCVAKDCDWRLGAFVYVTERGINGEFAIDSVCNKGFSVAMKTPFDDIYVATHRPKVHVANGFFVTKRAFNVISVMGAKDIVSYFFREIRGIVAEKL